MNNKDRNIELHIKMKRDWVVVPVVARDWDREGFYIGEDLYGLEEFDYNEEEERYYSLDGRLMIQI